MGPFVRGLAAAFARIAAGLSLRTGIFVGLSPFVGALTGIELMVFIKNKMLDFKHPGQHLTDGEKANVEGLFGKQLPSRLLNKLTKHLVPDSNGRMAACVRHLSTRRIEFFGKTYHEADYSQAASRFNAGTFIHEMTHIWQNRHPLRSRSLLHKFRHAVFPKRFACDNKVYAYELKDASNFKSFGIEQQAAIMEDYALRVLFNTAARRMEGTPRNDILLQEVVEEAFPQARETRLKLEAQRRETGVKLAYTPRP